MSRIVFDSLKELKKWANVFLKTGRYVIYKTTNSELILTPIVNPRDNQYVYFKAHSKEEIKEFEEYVAIREIKMFEVKDYDWRLDVSVGVRTTSEVD